MKRKTTTTAGQTGTTRRAGSAPPVAPPVPAASESGGVRPWHLLVLGVLLACAAGAVATRDGGTVQTVAVIVTLMTAGLVAAGLVRTFGPLVTADAGEETEMLAGRTRAALEREKFLVLRSIKEVEFDRAMRKISDADYQEIVPRLRTRAVGLIRQLEGGGGYRELIERDLAALLPSLAQARSTPTADALGEREIPPQHSVIPANAGIQPATSPDPGPVLPGTCPDCSTLNDKDARFCKSCGIRIAGDV
jgi:hypothetical protein